MLFYKFRCSFTSPLNDIEKNYERNREIDDKCQAYYMSSEDKFRLCYIDLEVDNCTIIGIFRHDVLCEKQSCEYAADFINHTTASGKVESAEEITMEVFFNSLCRARLNGFVSREKYITAPFGIEDSIHSFDEDKQHQEICAITKSIVDAKEAAKQLCLKDTLLPELNRIYKQGNHRLMCGHPVQYTLSTSSSVLTDKAVDMLISALYANKRVISRRYSWIDLMSRSNDRDLVKLYEIAKGGTVVVRCGENDSEDEYAGSIHRKIEIVSKMIVEHSHQVLTVLCFDKADKKTMHMFLESLPGIAFVNINEDTISANNARLYLKRCAEERGAKSVRGLYSDLRDTQYSVHQLDGIFNRWYDKHLRNNVFPQYSAYVKPCNVSKQFKGDAFRDLDEMIGLSESKETIKKAVDYYKAQKMFAEYEAFLEQPSMHMVFTGNPGTAKTTVARLFAKIMHDNGLLASGVFIEAGRADLVGKYVGWTASIVKNKFRQAKGGVLFIDEAYSLVDDRQGMYGDEAINTIVQEMENMRNEIVVIFAGYPDEMKMFLERNPGLKSRIAFHLDFPDYTAEELVDITILLAKQKKREISSNAKDNLKVCFEQASKDNNFGNGRYARNILEQAMMNQASRLVGAGYDKVCESQVRLLNEDDFDLKYSYKSKRKNDIGFL